MVYPPLTFFDTYTNDEEIISHLHPAVKGREGVRGRSVNTVIDASTVRQCAAASGRIRRFATDPSLSCN